MKIVVNQESLSKFYSVILAWVPLFGIYRSFIPGVSIGEFVLLICALFTVLLSSKAHTMKNQTVLEIFALYSIITTMFAFIIGTYEFYWIHRLLRIVFYIFCICYVSNKLFDLELFFRSANMLSIILFSGIAIQYFAYYSSGIYIRLYGNLLPIMDNELLILDYQYIVRISTFRPSSFFTEPSHVAQYLMIPFVYNIYRINEDTNRKTIMTSIMIGLTILLSKSLWGYGILAIIVVYWILDSGKTRHNLAWYIIVPIVFVVGTVALINSGIFKDTFSRIDFLDLGSSQSFTGRFGGYDLLLGKSFLSRLFGSGFAASVQNRPITNSVLLLLFGSGYIGSLIILVFIVSVFVNKTWLWQRTLAVSLFALMFGSNILFSTLFILVCTCLLYTNIPRKSLAEVR